MDARGYPFDPTRSAGAGLLSPFTLPGVLEATLARFGDRPAVVDGPVRLTWHEAAAQARAFATALQALRIEKGDVVGLHLPNCHEYLIAHLGVALAGAIGLPLHVPYREAELRMYLGKSAAKAIVGYADATERMVRVAHDLPDLQAIVTLGPGSPAALGWQELLCEFAGRSPAPVRIAPEDPFMLFSTSGTESLRPKICIHTQGGFLSNSDQVGTLARVSERDVILCASGFTHAFGIIAVQFAVLRGAALVCLPKFDAAEFLRLVRIENVTMAWAVTAQLADVTKLHKERAGQPVASLREIRTGGTPVTRALNDAVRGSLCSNFVVQWGMSEIACGAVTRYGDPPEAALTLGFPLDGAEIRIVEGELWYRRACMFRGYVDDPEATTAAVAPGGWMRTGDLVSLDGNGRLVYQGRSKDIINRGGMKVSAFELEALLSTLPAIRQLAVVAVEDERLGERACVVCSLHDDATLTVADIAKFLAAHDVAKYKWPERLVILDRLPMTPTGKVAKSAVRALVAQKVTA